LIAKLTFVECVKPPPVAVTVRGYVPLGALVLGDIDNVDLPEPGTVAGLNDALVRAGNPVTLNFTLAENGPRAETVTVYVVLEFLVTV
jgi:hypothetical protein